jgi:large subunit ribosomal protein L25
MQTFNLTGNRRDHVGRNSSRDIRKQNMIPCVLYGNGENINFEVAEPAVKNLVYTPHVYKVIVTIDGVDHETLMREIQFHPVTDSIMHIDFLQLNPNKKVTCQVPVRLEGQSIGVKEGGKLIQRLRKLTIRALPNHLVDKVVIDVTDLDVSKTIRIGDIQIDQVEVLGSKSMPVATVLSPRALKAMADAAAAAEAAAKAAVTPAATTTAVTPETTAGAEETKEAGKEEKKD